MKIALLFTFALLLVTSNALIVKSFEQIEKQFELIDSFGFLSGGVVEIKNISILNALPDSKPLWLLICSQSEYIALFGGLSSNDPCSDESKMNSSCSFLARQFSGAGLSLHEVVTVYDTYYMEIANCEKANSSAVATRTWNVSLDYSFYNPGPLYLGYGYIPMPTMFQVMIAFWILLLTWWISQIMRFRSKSTRLHTILCSVPVVKCLWSAAGAYYYLAHLLQGEVPNSQPYYIYLVAYLVDRCCIFGCLMLVASGYGSITSKLGKHKYWSTLVCIGIISSLVLGIFVQQLLQMFRYVVYVVALVLVFRNINQNLILLHLQQQRNLPEPQIYDPTNIYTIIDSKLDLFKHLRLSMLGYIGFVMLCLLIEILVLINYYWVSIFIRECQDLLLTFTVFFIFRPQSTTEDFDLSQMEQDEEELEDEY